MLYQYLKRNSRKLFNPDLGFGTYIYEQHSKFLCNRYGVVKHFYGPNTELAVIENDIKKLIDQQYYPNLY